MTTPTVTKGTVATAFQGLGMYSVATDTHGTVTCYAVGLSRGRLGSQETSTYAIGTPVLCVILPVMPNVNFGVIIGGASDRVSPYTILPPVLSQYPQTTGVQFVGSVTEEDKLAEDPEARRILSRWYQKNQRIGSYGAGVRDAVDGDWAMTNFFGSGVGVEAFRAWLRGGPMSSVECFADDQVTRVVGATFELFTMGRYYVDKVYGPVSEVFDSRSYYTSDSMANADSDPADVAGQFYAIDSPLLLGKQEHFYPRVKDNSSKTVAPDLVHEHRGVDGSYTLTTASALTLQKFVGVRTFRRPLSTGDAGLVKAESLPNALNPAAPSGISFTDVPDAVPERAEQTPQYRRLSLLSAASFIVANAYKLTGESQTFDGVTAYAKVPAIAGVLARAGLNLAIVNHTAGNPALLNRHAVNLGKIPAAKLSADGSDEPVPVFDGIIDRDPSMWKRSPTSFVLNVGPYGQSKRFFFGHAFITITDEGDIILQNASGAQVMLAGGNVYVTSEHDVIVNAGRNLVNMAGQDSVTRVSRHMDVVTHEGRMTMQAAGQMTVIGGAAGAAGVTIESRGRSTVGSTNDGNTAQDNSGLRLVAKHAAIAMSGASLVGSFKQPCFITMPQFGFYNMLDTYTVIGNGVWTANKTKTSFIMPESAYFHVVHAIDAVAAKNFKTASVTTNAEKLLAGTNSTACTLSYDLQAAKLALSGISDSGSFQASADYNVVAKESFAIPLPAWYLSRLREYSLNLFNSMARWTVPADTSANSHPLPGFSYIGSYGAGTRSNLATKDPGQYQHQMAPVIVEAVSLGQFGKGI